MKLIMTPIALLIAATAWAQPDPVALARDALIVDTHIDVPYRLVEKWEDVSRLTSEGDFDLPRARAGGLDVPFMSIYTPATSEAKGTAHQTAHQLIDSVEALVGRAPEDFVIVTTPTEALSARNAGKIGLAMGMENGSPLEGDLDKVRAFRERGISYITLTHSLSNHISDSSYDEDRPNQGLSEFGRQVVVEMNRQGILVDVSHVSDAAFWQALELSRVPVIASHSSARHFTPGWERNMDDEMIRAMAARGGVIMINFGSSFVREETRAWYDRYTFHRNKWLLARGLTTAAPEVKDYEKAYRAKHPFPYASLDEVVANFLYVIELAGVDHVGIGSDFDGLGDSLPVGLKNVADYPKLVAALLDSGLDEEDLRKILGGNIMRVWSQAVGFAQGLE